jgi:signal transduction histidine kinase
MSIITYGEYKKIDEIKHLVALEESNALAKFIKSFRKVYLNAFVDHEININKDTLNLLPVKTLPLIAEEFENLLGGNVAIRTVSDRPRNPKNAVNDFEKEVIQYFKENREKESYVSHETESSHSFFVPLYIQKSCLKCHGKKEDAIEAIRVRYDKAYGYKLGDLRGMIHLKISDKETFTELDNAFYRGLLAKGAIFIIIVALLYYLINTIRRNELAYTKKLELKVNEQVSQLREKDEILNTQSKMASLGEMLENIAHQWRQPLSVITSASTGIKVRKHLDDISDEEIDESLDGITKSAKYLSSTIDDFRDFFKSNKEKEFFSIKDTYEKTLIIIDSKFKNKEIDVISDIDDLQVYGVQNELMQVLMNILNNAKDVLIESKNEKKLIFVTIKQIDDSVKILIKDNANGIPQDIKDKIFDPYFTTKHKSQGTGIGLYMSQEIISKHFDGELLVENCEYMYENEKYVGAQFEIRLSAKVS